MIQKVSLSAVALLSIALSPKAMADSYAFSFAGPGVSGTVTLQYGTATDAKYPGQAYEVTGISGTFSDSNIGISNALITGLVPINYATPEPGNTAAPSDFSKYAVAAGLPAPDTSITFDNLYWPGGSPVTGSDYPFSGGFLDVYGILFDISGGDVVDLWSNGILPGSSAADYGVAVDDPAASLDYVGNGVAPTPEPGTFALLGTGLAALLARRSFFRRTRT